jgi:hypothetical protein
MKTHMKRLVRLVAAAAMLLAFSSPARADVISLGSGETASFDILWSRVVSGVDLTALGEFTVSLQDTYVDVLITLTNNTLLESEKIHSIGFNTDPSATGLTNVQAGTYFTNFNLNTTFPDFQTIDICVYTANNCAGGPETGNLPGNGGTDTFGFRLLGDFSGGLALSTFAVKFQGDLGSFEFEGHRPPASVPEPSGLMLTALGLAATGIARRRRI